MGWVVVGIKWGSMGPLIRSGERFALPLALLSLAFCATYLQAQPVSGRCAVSSAPDQVRSEGLTERMGDIILQCSGSNPGAALAGNLSVFLPIAIANRVDANNFTTDAVLSVDYGIGFVPSAVQGQISNRMIAFNGLNFTIPPSGNINLKISGIRADANQMAGAGPNGIQAQITGSLPIALSQSTVTVAYPQAGLYDTLYNTGIACTGSPAPTAVDMSGLFASKTAFASTRLTEGFANAFQPRGPGEDTGTRFLIEYTNFPAGAHLYVPNLVAGADAAAPTNAGDLGGTQNPGQYLPGSGTLLLALVPYADPTGMGSYTVPIPTGNAPVALNAATEIPLTNGSGYAVYEVVDSNPSRLETVQFPTFLAIPANSAPATARETVSFAPVSNVMTASTTAPVPRFAPVTPTSDCSLVGDCSAGYFPKLSVVSGPLQFTGVAGGESSNLFIQFQNIGGGIMNWTATPQYIHGSGWLTLEFSSGQTFGQKNATDEIWASPKNLAAGTYQANIVIDAGSIAGVVTVPVTLTVQPAPAPPPTPAPNPTPPAPPTATGPTVTQVVNAATFAATPLVPGSLGTVMGSNLAGTHVSVTFDGLPATLLYTSAGQINLQVPLDLGSKTSASLVVTVDGAGSSPQTVALAPAWPAIFSGGVLNQDNSVNAAGRGAPAGSILQIFTTGVPQGAIVTAQVGAHRGLVPLYAGPAPTAPGVQQINVAVPDDATAGITPLAVCATLGSQQYCSPAYSLTVR